MWLCWAWSCRYGHRRPARLHRWLVVLWYRCDRSPLPQAPTALQLIGVCYGYDLHTTTVARGLVGALCAWVMAFKPFWGPHQCRRYRTKPISQRKHGACVRKHYGYVSDATAVMGHGLGMEHGVWGMWSTSTGAPVHPPAHTRTDWSPVHSHDSGMDHAQNTITCIYHAIATICDGHLPTFLDYVTK